MVMGACEMRGDNMRIACVRGGPAGLYFALLMKLRDPGHDITVFERNTADSTQGWGVTFGRDLLKELHRSDPESAQEIDQAAFRQFDQVVDIHGKLVLHPGGGGYGISRQRLLDILADRAKGLGERHLDDHPLLGQEVTVLGELHRRVGPKAKAIYSRHKPVQPGNRSAIRRYVKRGN